MFRPCDSSRNGLGALLRCFLCFLGPQEFFHFVIFLTMLCYIATVLILLRVSASFPQLWHVARAPELTAEDGDTPTPTLSARSLPSPSPSRAALKADSDPGAPGRGLTRTKQVLDEYLDVQARLDTHSWGPWGRKLDLRMQGRLYRAVNRVAFRLCKSQAKAIYSSRRLMHAMFDTSMDIPRHRLTFAEYSLRATQLLLVEVLEVHWTNWAAVLLLLLANAARVKAGASVNLTGADEDTSGGDRGTAVFVSAGVLLVVANFSICYKGWAVLQRVVESRIPRGGENGVRRWHDVGKLVRPVLLAIGEIVVAQDVGMRRRAVLKGGVASARAH